MPSMGNKDAWEPWAGSTHGPKCPFFCHNHSESRCKHKSEVCSEYVSFKPLADSTDIDEDRQNQIKGSSPGKYASEGEIKEVKEITTPANTKPKRRITCGSLTPLCIPPYDPPRKQESPRQKPSSPSSYVSFPSFDASPVQALSSHSQSPAPLSTQYESSQVSMRGGEGPKPKRSLKFPNFFSKRQSSGLSYLLDGETPTLPYHLTGNPPGYGLRCATITENGTVYHENPSLPQIVYTSLLSRKSKTKTIAVQEGEMVVSIYGQGPKGLRQITFVFGPVEGDSEEADDDDNAFDKLLRNRPLLKKYEGFVSSPHGLDKGGDMSREFVSV